MNYQSSRNVRREARTLRGELRGGKLHPVMITPVLGNEGGMISQSITMELKPIAGRLITPITAELTSVFVPVQAMDALKFPDADYAGLTEVIREKLLTGNPLFDLENDNLLAEILRVNPVKVSGVAKVNEVVRLAHNAAVNFLRQRKYVKATLLASTNLTVTPAIITKTILERMDGVLDPEDRVNGSVKLNFGNMKLPVSGVAVGNSPAAAAAGVGAVGLWSDSASGALGSPTVSHTHTRNAAYTYFATDASGVPQIFANLGDGDAGSVSLTDFYLAEKQDALVRAMRKMVDDNPEYGEEVVLRWAHGLSVDNGRIPVVIAERSVVFGQSLQTATDAAGIEADVKRSDMMVNFGFDVMAPKTELGGVVITFASVKPDETVSSQPHPFFGDVWSAQNFVADEMALDPVPVTIRQLDSNCTSGQESTVAFYTGHNAIKRLYVDYGLTRNLDPNDVSNKTAVWQLEIPTSVTPDNILYPVNLEHYPFADQAADCCIYTINHSATLQTPMIFGPSPVEELAIIETADIFEDAPE